MAKAKTTVEIVTEYFQMIRYYEDEEKLIVILPEGLNGIVNICRVRKYTKFPISYF